MSRTRPEPRNLPLPARAYDAHPSRRLAALLLAAPLAAQAPAADSAPVDALRRELLEMGRVDQEVRVGFSPGRVQDTAYMRRMSSVDSAHTARMREILRVHGWAGIGRVGPKPRAPRSCWCSTPPTTSCGATPWR